MSLINRRIHQRILEKKKRLGGYRPLPPGFVARLRNELMIEYTYDSNAIEGSSLTLRETRLIIEEGITIGGKSIKEYLGAKNHPEAVKFIEDIVKMGKYIDEEVVLRLHELILHDIEESAGKYRTTGVRIAGATFAPPPSSKVKPMTVELLQWLRENPDELTPIELSAVFHHRFVQIHPFENGNGRTVRLLMNGILFSYGYPFIINITVKDRKKYLDNLSEADMGNISAFVNFIARNVEYALDIYLRAVDEPEVLSLAEAAKYSPYTQEYLSLLARKGAIAAFKKGRKWYITKKDLERYVKSIEAKKNRATN